jgi:hypothetical protein
MKLPYRIITRIHNVIDGLVFPIIVGFLWAILTFVITKSVITNNAQ